MMHKKSGYILPLVLIILSLCVALIVYMYTRTMTYAPLMQTKIEREKAVMAALGGVQIGIAQLSKVHKEEKEKTEPGKPTPGMTPDKQAALFLADILPHLNRWQEFLIEGPKKSKLARIKISITAEDGKINLNEIYNFDKHTFIGQGQPQGDWKKIMQTIIERLGKMTGGDKLFEAFEKFLKGRQYKFNDVTELLQSKEFAVFKDSLFYEPAEKKGSEDKQSKQPVYLTDIFTIHSTKPTLEPWLLSDSILAILDLKRAQPNDSESRRGLVAEAMKDFKKNAPVAQIWNKKLAPFYGKELQSLPKGIESVFSAIFEPQTFAILSYGTVGKVTRRLLAIVERVTKSIQGKTVYDVSLKKLYWL